jgi:hypothetical protein
MASNFPTSLDTGSEQPSPVSGTGLDDAGFEHDVVHANHSTALIAVETKVGIGSSTPVADSVLAGSAAGVSGWTGSPTFSGAVDADKFTITSAGGRSIELAVDDSGLYSHIGTTSNHDFRLMANGSVALTVESNGNVGIGTTAPAVALEVSDASAAIIRLDDTGGVKGGATNARIQLYAGGVEAGSIGFPSTASGLMQIENRDGPIYLETDSADGIYFRTNGSTGMTVTSQGKVGIGTTTPSTPLHVLSSGSDQLRLQNTSSTTKGPYISLYHSTARIGYIGFPNNDDLYLKNESSAGHIYLSTNNTTRMFVKSNGNVGIGTTSPSSTLHVAGALTIKSGSYLAGYLYGASTSAGAGFNVVGSGGASIGFMGSPNNDDMHYQSTHSSGYFYLMVGSAYRCYSTNSGGWIPYVDNTYDLGYSSKRWDDVWATNGTIQTSDVNFKKDIADTTLGLDFINALRPVEYKWLEGSRKHQGFIAQEVETVLDTQDIAADQAMWGINVFKDGETHIEPIEDENGIPQKVEVPTIPKQSLRYNEFIGPLVKAVQELSARIETLETV